MDKTKLKYFVDIGLAISFFISLITGIFKFPGLTHYFRAVFRLIPTYYMSRLHDWSGLAIGILVFVHLVLNWRWITAMTKNMLKKKKL